jgi:hypothetical protein
MTLFIPAFFDGRAWLALSAHALPFADARAVAFANMAGGRVQTRLSGQASHGPPPQQKPRRRHHNDRL